MAPHESRIGSIASSRGSKLGYYRAPQACSMSKSYMLSSFLNLTVKAVNCRRSKTRCFIGYDRNRCVRCSKKGKLCHFQTVDKAIPRSMGVALDSSSFELEQSNHSARSSQHHHGTMPEFTLGDTGVKCPDWPNGKESRCRGDSSPSLPRTAQVSQSGDLVMQSEIFVDHAEGLSSGVAQGAGSQRPLVDFCSALHQIEGLSPVWTSPDLLAHSEPWPSWNFENDGLFLQHHDATNRPYFVSWPLDYGAAFDQVHL